MRNPRTPRGRRTTKTRGSEPQPAPGDLRIVHAFVNTVDVGSEADELASPDGLKTWLAKWGLLPEDVELTESDAGRARDVRTGLRSLMLAHGGVELDPEVIARLERATAGVGPRLRFDADGSTRLELLARTFEEALGSLIGLVFTAQLEGTWSRLKVCGDQECRTVFYDTSSNRVSKWCSLRCGNRMRARAYRGGKKYRRRAGRW